MFVSDLQEQERPQLSGAVGNPTSHLAQWVLSNVTVSVLRTLVCLAGLRGGVVDTFTRVGGQPAANVTLWVLEGEDHSHAHSLAVWTDSERQFPDSWCHVAWCQFCIKHCSLLTC